MVARAAAVDEPDQDFWSAAADVLPRILEAWRAAASDPRQLRPLAVDEERESAPPGRCTAAPLPPHTPTPAAWVDPTAHSPLAHFKTPQTLQRLQLLPPPPLSGASALRAASTSSLDASGGGCLADEHPSPKTPSPMQPVLLQFSLQDTLRATLTAGRYIGEVDIRSSQINDDALQLVLRSCVNIHTLRLQHVCPRVRVSPPQRCAVAGLVAGQLTWSSPPSAGYPCACLSLTAKGFENIASFCTHLSSVTLLLQLCFFLVTYQHVMFSKDLRQVLQAVGRLRKLETLVVELRKPSFRRSLKAELMWREFARCSDRELQALLGERPPPLRALSLNNCELTAQAVAELAKSCPQIEALELQCGIVHGVAHGDIRGLAPALVVQLQALPALACAALGVFHHASGIDFAKWSFPAIRRLRLSTVQRLSLKNLVDLKHGCPSLDSLHLLWGRNLCHEAHFCPVLENTLADFEENMAAVAVAVAVAVAHAAASERPQAMASDMKPSAYVPPGKSGKPGLEEGGGGDSVHRIRITLSSKNVKNLEKGERAVAALDGHASESSGWRLGGCRVPRSCSVARRRTTGARCQTAAASSCGARSRCWALPWLLGAGTNTWDRFELRVHKRVIDLHSPSEVVKQITSISIEPGVEVEVTIADV
eukprot:SM000107S14079  [mRNA]  locus=s107:386667:391495:+ [translate_table: standard]